MSAKFNKEQDRVWLKVDGQNSMLRVSYPSAALVETFDLETEWDYQILQREVEEFKKIRRACFAKILMFPMEWAILRVVMGQTHAYETYLFATLYWKMIRNKIDFTEYKKEYAALVEMERNNRS